MYFWYLFELTFGFRNVNLNLILQNDSFEEFRTFLNTSVNFNYI